MSRDIGYKEVLKFNQLEKKLEKFIALSTSTSTKNYIVVKSYNSEMRLSAFQLYLLHIFTLL